MIYEVAKVRDVSTGGARRLVVDVVVTGQPTTDELTAIAEEVADLERRGEGYEALSVAFHDFVEAVEYGPRSLGRWCTPHTATGDGPVRLDAVATIRTSQSTARS